MRVTHVPLPDIITLARMVDLSPDDGEEDEYHGEGEELKPGRYAMDGTGTVWRREDTVTTMFQEFMDLAPALKSKKRGK